MNVTPNSFSDGGELSTPEQFHRKLKEFGPVDAIDIGAESTAPMNDPIAHHEEWKRLEGLIPYLKEVPCAISIDSYHPETVETISKIWIDEKLNQKLIWNDVSGKFDDQVLKFLRRSDHFHYVLCHNLAPIRELTSSHMEYLSKSVGNELLDELASHFRSYIHPRVIFDPTLGFSKSYDQNWFILENFDELQLRVPHQRWLLGFSRKSFLRKKYGIEKMTPESREELDLIHLKEMARLRPKFQGEIWIRTHRPEYLNV